MNHLRVFLTTLFGKISWQKPMWWSRCLHNLTNKQKGICLATLGIMLLGAITLYWYQHVPQPILPTAEIQVPEILLASDQTEPPAPLHVRWTKNGEAQAVAPLTALNQTITQGITLTPAMTGTWQWQSDSELVFYPTAPWLAGTTYTLAFARKIFAPQVKLEKYRYQFTTQPFQANIAELKLYQNPKDPTDQRIVGTVQFNYPVGEDFAQHVMLIPQKLKNQQLDLSVPRVPITVTFGKLNREAYIHSNPVSLSTHPQYLVLLIDQNTQTVLGKVKLQKTLQEKVLLPDADSLLTITQTDSSIVRNLNGLPEQILTLHTSIGVTNSALQQALAVYQLPKNYPASGIAPEKANYAWSSAAEVTPEILKLAKPIPVQAIASDQPYPMLHNLRYQAEANSYLYVKVKANLAGYGGYHLKSAYQTVVSVPAYPKEISFLHEGSLLALSDQHKLSVRVRGLPAVKFVLSRILPDKLIYLVSQTKGQFNNPYFLSANFTANDISEVYSEVQHLNSADPAQAQYTVIDFNKYTAPNAKNPSPLGLFLLQGREFRTKNPADAVHTTDTAVPTPDPEDSPNENPGITANRLVLLTNMALIVKTNNDNSHEVFVHSITKGQPIDGAKVAILGRNGLAIATAITNQQGHAHFPDMSQFNNEQEPVVYLATQGNDVSFIPFAQRDRGINYSRFDIAGVTDNQASENLNAYIFSERGLYRPGDKVHFGIIVKQAFAKVAAEGIPLQITITDPQGNPVFTEKKTLDKTGLLTLDYATSPSALTGEYTLALSLIKNGHDKENLGTTSFRIAEFLPDTLKISTAFTQAPTMGWIKPENLGAVVTLQNLFGTPAPDHKVTSQLTLLPHNFAFAPYPGFIFQDPLYDPNKPPHTITDELPPLQTDSQGQAEFNFNLGRFDKGTYQLTFYAQGFAAASGRSVSTKDTLLISPLDYLLGYKTDGNLNFIKQKQLREITLLAINSRLEKIALTKLQLRLLKIKRVATLITKPDQTYAYQSVLQETPIATRTLNLPANPTPYTLDTENVGDYILEIVTTDGLTLSRVAYSVAGDSASGVEKNTELSLKLNKTEFKPGEAITLQITAPYAGSGLITLERDKVYATKWFNTTVPNSVQTIRVPEDFVGNGYINVTFIRDWHSPEIFLNPLSFNVVPFTVNRQATTLNITLRAPTEVQPGTVLPIQYSTDQPGKILVFAVDEGILQAANYVTPNPLAYFFQKRTLGVSTTQTIDQILPKFIAARELSAVGGDSGNADLRNLLNPFKRKAEPAVVYWSGLLAADTVPRTLNYTLPDYFNGSLRIMAVAVNPNAVGSQSTTTLVRSELILQPSVPTVVAPGDKFSATVAVTNNIKNSSALPISVKLTTSNGLTVLTPNTQTLIVKPQQEQVAHFTVAATPALGNATLTFTANAQTHASHRQATTSVRPALPYQTTLISGSATDSKKTLALPQNFYAEFLQQSVAAALSPAILLPGLQAYLNNYPYGCTEQVTSTAFGLLTFATYSGQGVALQLQQKLQDVITILQQRHTSAGSFVYWPNATGIDFASRFSSIYALHFLTEAHEKNLANTLDLLQSGLDYLHTEASATATNLEDALLKAYAIYLLARNGIVPTHYLTDLQLFLEEKYPNAWRSNIISGFIASTYKMLQDDKTANQLITGYRLQPLAVEPRATYNNFFDHAETTNPVYIYLLSKHFPAQFSRLPDSAFLTLIANLAGNQLNTLTAAYTLLALSAYAPPSAASILIQAQSANKKLVPLPSAQNAIKPVPFPHGTQALQFINNTGKRYFYQITQAGYPRDLPKQAITQGLEIVREYSLNNQPITTAVAQGQEITVNLKLRTLNQAYYQYIAIVDLLPGGFELVPDSIQGEFAYYNAREDRIIFYTSARDKAITLSYKIKADSKGEFVVPPPFAENMYNQYIMATGVASQIKVN